MSCKVNGPSTSKSAKFRNLFKKNNFNSLYKRSSYATYHFVTDMKVVDIPYNME